MERPGRKAPRFVTAGLGPPFTTTLGASLLWFLRQRFEYAPSATHPVARLKQVLSDPKWGNIASEVSPGRVLIERKLGFFLRNSWNPIFQGRFVIESGRSYLVGHFRVHWLVAIFTVLFLAYPLYDIFTLLPQPDVRPGYVAGWKDAQITWDLQFFGFAVLIVIAGWLFGLPNAKRIRDAINESTRGT